MHRVSWIFSRNSLMKLVKILGRGEMVLEKKIL